jgi:hypothetical protein
MRKTFCDRDGRECESRTGHLHLAVIQQTNKGEVVSEDEYRPMDLCGPCIDELVNTFLGGKIALHYNTKADIAIAGAEDTAAPVRSEPG